MNAWLGYVFRNFGRRRLRTTAGALGIFLTIALLVAIQIGLDSVSASYTDLVALQAGKAVTANLPPCPGDRVRLELRVRGWVPQQVIPGSNDASSLGIQVFRVTMRSASGGTNVFNANRGTWLAPAKPKP